MHRDQGLYQTLTTSIGDLRETPAFASAGGVHLPTVGIDVYPVRQRWLASRTQMANEPTYVDEGQGIASGRISYGAVSILAGPMAWWSARRD